jgi:hypothetical protein
VSHEDDDIVAQFEVDLGTWMQTGSITKLLRDDDLTLCTDARSHTVEV